MKNLNNQFDIKSKELIEEFTLAPEFALFKQNIIALLLNCSEDKIERDRWLGEGIPFIKCGRCVRYRKKDILEWLESREAFQSTTQAQHKATK